jgi:hypothetical protein
MKTVSIIAVLVLLAAVAVGGYQIGSLYLANLELTGDLKDLSSLTGTQIGLVANRSVDDIRLQVIEHAEEHGIHLEREQVNIERIGEGKEGSIYLSTAYDRRINLFGLDLTFHFTAASPRNS